MSAVVAAESSLKRAFDPVRDLALTFALAQVPVAAVRERGQDIQRDPTPDEPAHVLVVGHKTKKLMKAMARASSWAWPPPGRPYP